MFRMTDLRRFLAVFALLLALLPCCISAAAGLAKPTRSYPINGNPDFVRGNWRGAGELYFPDPVFHMFDFMGQGAEEVITLS